MTPNYRFWSKLPVCVVGGTGFLGWHLARHLAAAGAAVRAFGLPPRNDHPLLLQSDIEVIFGDVCDRAVVKRALAGRAAVFNAAGVVAATAADRERFYAVHRAAVQNVLDAAPADARIVHTSSITTLGPSHPDEPATEDTAPTDELGIDYVRAKCAAEKVALDAAADGLDVVVTNPGFLVGPEDHDRSMMGRVCLKYWNGRLPLVPPGGVNAVDVRDVAAGHLLATERGAAGRRYVLGGENRSSDELLAMLAAAAGMRPRLSPRLPGWGLFAVAAVVEGYARLRGRVPFPSWQDARLQGQAWYAASNRAARELGYRPRPLCETLADSFAWHRDRGLITPRGLRRWWARPDRATGAVPAQVIASRAV